MSACVFHARCCASSARISSSSRSRRNQARRCRMMCDMIFSIEVSKEDEVSKELPKYFFELILQPSGFFESLQSFSVVPCFPWLTFRGRAHHPGDRPDHTLETRLGLSQRAAA